MRAAPAEPATSSSSRCKAASPSSMSKSAAVPTASGCGRLVAESEAGAQSVRDADLYTRVLRGAFGSIARPRTANGLFEGARRNRPLLRLLLQEHDI